MADPTFLNLLRGNRLSGFIRLKMSEGFVYRLATDYTYAELPLAAARTADGEKVEGEKLLRNQTIELIAPATVRPTNGYKCLMVINPVLHRVASVPSMLMFDSSDMEIPVSTYARFHKDLPVAYLEWLCRIYLIN